MTLSGVVKNQYKGANSYTRALDLTSKASSPKNEAWNACFTVKMFYKLAFLTVSENQRDTGVTKHSSDF